MGKNKPKFNIADRFMNEIIWRSFVEIGGFCMTRGEIAKYLRKDCRENGMSREEIRKVVDGSAYAPGKDRVIGNALDGDSSFSAEEVASILEDHKLAGKRV